MPKETTINDKNNTKVIAKLHQVHFKVKIEKKCQNIYFFIKFNAVNEAINYYKDWFCNIIDQTYFPKHFQEIEGSVNHGRGLTPLFPLLHSFPNV